jgi:hypothetical protein
MERRPVSEDRLGWALAMRVEIEAVGWCNAASGTCEFFKNIAEGTLKGPSSGDRLTQVARCRVEDKLVFIVHALIPTLGDDERAALVAALPSDRVALVAFLLEASVGGCRLDVLGSDPTEGAHAVIAMAAAVVQASWAWDESDRISVIIGDQTIRVAARHDTKGWSAEAEA